MESSGFRTVRFKPERSVWHALLAGERLDLLKGARHGLREGRPPLKSAVGACFTPKRGLPAQQGFRRGREWQQRVDLRRSRDAMAVARPARMQASGPKAGSGNEAAGQAVPHRSTASGNSGHLEPCRPTTEISLKRRFTYPHTFAPRKQRCINYCTSKACKSAPDPRPILF